MDAIVQDVLEIRQEDGRVAVYPTGRWVMEEAERLQTHVNAFQPPERTRDIAFDLSKLDNIDTAGTWLLVRLVEGAIGRGIQVSFRNASESHGLLLEEVSKHRSDAPVEPREPFWALKLTEDVGQTVANTAYDFVRVAELLGQNANAVVRVVARPWRFRMTSFTHHVEHTGLRAVGIVGLMSLLIGGIVAQQAAFQLRKFGAELFVIDLVGILVLRELGVLLTAIMFAGRSGSAFTAEIGSMKMREEIDALRIIGLDPVETLVVPRLFALMVALPLVTVVSDIMCLLGAGIVSWAYMGIGPETFLQRLQAAVTVQTFIVGLIKAPFMALIIGLIACVEGMKVTGSAESLGRQTTSSVVKAIFVVIVVDGFFAMFFASIDF